MALIDEMKKDGVVFTDNPYAAIWLFPDGQMVDGEFDSGIRGTDHNVIMSYYNDDLDEMLADGLIMIVPETQSYIVSKDWRLTAAQEEILNQLNYKRFYD